MISVRLLAGFLLFLMLFATGVHAQTQSADSKPADGKPCNEPKAEFKNAPEIYQTLYITNLSQQNDLTDILTDLRNMIPKARFASISAQNAISMHGTPDDIQLAQKIVADLDQPRKIYRLTYTITESDNGKHIGSQHFVLIAASGMKTFLRQGSKVPVFVGENSSMNAELKVQFVGAEVKYEDIGLTIEATPDGNPQSLSLRTKVEQSSLAEEKSGLGEKDPMISQSVLEGISTLQIGKQLVLGSLDIPGSTRKQEIEVVAELVR